jgi:hypothetical protein
LLVPDAAGCRRRAPDGSDSDIFLRHYRVSRAQNH